MTEKPIIQFVFADDNGLGYGRMGQEINKCLNAKGIDTVQVIPGIGNRIPTGDFGSPQTISEQVPRVVLHNRLSVHVQEKYVGQHLTLFTMFETDQVPADYIENMHNFDQIIVPSKQNLEMFKEAHPCVHYIPLGVDQNWWVPTERKVGGPLIFLTAGNGMHRKGFDVVCEAFTQAAIPNSQLIVKCNPADHMWTLKEKYPNVTVLQERLDAEEERKLYEMAHVFVGLSRGEGFGLQPLQAIHQGLPTIASLSSGHLEYKELFYQIPTTVTDAEYGIWGYVGRWWEPDLDAAIEAMRYMAENYDHVKYEAYHQAKRLEAVGYWSWERVTNDIIRILPQPFDTIEPWKVERFKHYLFKVIPTRDALFGVGDRQIGMKAGYEYWVPADQKRMLYDQSALDPSCLRENMGLDMEFVKSYQPLYDRCPTCQRQLTPLPKDEDFEEMIYSDPVE